MKKKVLALLLATTMITGLTTGCGGGKSDTPTAADNTSASNTSKDDASAGSTSNDNASTDNASSGDAAASSDDPGQMWIPRSMLSLHT